MLAKYLSMQLKYVPIKRYKSLLVEKEKNLNLRGDLSVMYYLVFSIVDEYIIYT